MAHRLPTKFSDQATIDRETQAGKNELGEPITETVTIAEDVACAYSSDSTSFVREDSGERVQRPATIRFRAGVDVQEGDTITVDTAAEAFEVRGVEEVRNHRLGMNVLQRVEVERT